MPIGKRKHPHYAKAKRTPFTVERKLIAQIRFFETLHVIRDERGETIFTGSEEMAARILKVLKGDRIRKRRPASKKRKR